MKNPTGSSIERGVNCPASFALPQAPHTGEEGIKGTENHEGIEDDLVVGADSKYRVVREAVEGAKEVRVEVAYALDVSSETVRFLGSRIGRKYPPLKDDEIALTIDAVVLRDDDVVVWDWKSRKRVTAAKKNFQIRAGAVAVMKHQKVSRLVGAIGYLDNDEVDSHAFDDWDMATFFADMRTMLGRIRAYRQGLRSFPFSEPDVSSGPWCQYCPAMAYCPAQSRLAMTMLGEMDYIEKGISEFSPEQVGKAWGLLKQIQAMADRVESSLKLRARSDVIPLPNGKRLSLVECSRASFDKKKAIAWIKEHGGNPDEMMGRSYYEQVKEVNMKER